MSPQTTATHKMKGSADRRAELLADRIEEGAAGLAALRKASRKKNGAHRCRDRTVVLSASSCTMLPVSILLRLISREQSPEAMPLRTSRGKLSRS